LALELMKKKPKKKASKKRALVQGHLPFPLICDRCGKKMRDSKSVACAQCVKKTSKEAEKE